MPFGGLLTAGSGAGASLFGGLFGSNASKRAAQLQQEAADRANQYIQGNTNLNRDQINTLSADDRNLIQKNFAPYQGVGSTAAGGLNTALQNPFQFNLADDPGYQFRLAQGQKAIEQSAAARGGAVSGGALKALTQYGLGFASNEYQNAFARHQQQLQNLFQGAGLGLNASGQESSLESGAINNQLGLNTGLTEQTNQLIGNNITGAGNAGAAGAVGSANAWGGALNGVANSANQLFLYNLLNGGGSGGLSSINNNLQGSLNTSGFYNRPSDLNPTLSNNNGNTVMMT